MRKALRAFIQASMHNKYSHVLCWCYMHFHKFFRVGFILSRKKTFVFCNCLIGLIMKRDLHVFIHLILLTLFVRKI